MQSVSPLGRFINPVKSLEGEQSAILAFFAGKIYRLRGKVIRSVFCGLTPEVEEKKSQIGRDGQEIFMVNYKSVLSKKIA